MIKSKVFLGGTCNGSQWRDELIPKLIINWFNPVVENWTEECQQEEIKQRAQCSLRCYCITPKMTGVYSIAEMVEDSILRSNTSVICILDQDGDETWTIHQKNSLNQTIKLCTKYGASYCTTIQELAETLNIMGTV